ncbi:hypothetical protein [Methylobacterium aquaticum]|uniref:Uncharacterized protein n=1 Tax=Methylobacterium aquaticum TaxID=270351 RepID=A0A0C6F7R2_9HYPH|nr:hypothetical protein [Methylobacterium aquaticum]BAQ44373.1 hypothetical protein Maq22A_c04835 [Methylobacterium aquaticum]
MGLFDHLPTFAGLEVGVFTRGADAYRLTSAILTVKEAAAAATALGDPASAVRRAECLRILDALPVTRQRAILAAYHGKAPDNPKDGHHG